MSRLTISIHKVGTTSFLLKVHFRVAFLKSAESSSLRADTNSVSDITVLPPSLKHANQPGHDQAKFCNCRKVAVVRVTPVVCSKACASLGIRKQFEPTKY